MSTTTSGGHDRPVSSSPAASIRMKAVRRTGTRPEADLAAALSYLGLAFEANVSVEGMGRRRMDFLFSAQKVAVCVDGCFWHGCPEHGTAAKENGHWWRDKIETNRLRDADTARRLQADGWTLVRIWAHVPADSAAALIGDVLKKRDTETERDVVRALRLSTSG